MADEDVRRGYRAMISGGMQQLDNEALNVLSDSVAQAQRDRAQVPSLAEVQYLQAYSEICEQRMALTIEQSTAREQLNVLNEKFPSIVDSVRRLSINGVANLVDADDRGWMGSSYSC